MLLIDKNGRKFFLTFVEWDGSLYQDDEGNENYWIRNFINIGFITPDELFEGRWAVNAVTEQTEAKCGDIIVWEADNTNLHIIPTRDILLVIEYLRQKCKAGF